MVRYAKLWTFGIELLQHRGAHLANVVEQGLIGLRKLVSIGTQCCLCRFILFVKRLTPAA